MRFLTLLFVSAVSIADVKIVFDDKGEFIPPDLILQARGLDYYSDGYMESAFRNFKDSAKFGNERSKYLLALLNFQNKDWARGYAWLNLLKGSIENRDLLLNKIKPMLSDNELEQSERILASLKKEYNDITSYSRRNKWDRSFQGTGTHIRGIRAATLRNVSYDFGGYTPKEIREIVYENYVLEYEPRGQVIMGVITSIEKKK